MESGRVGEVERLLQLVTVVRAGDGLPVLRTSVIAQVEEYRTATIDLESINKLISNDQKRLAELGIAIQNVAPAGSEAAYVLRDGAWRLPIDLTELEQALLAWVMAAAGTAGAESSLTSSAPNDLSSLLGHVPRSLDLAQAAIAGRRRLIIERDGEEREFFPGLLASRAGRWFLLGLFEGDTDIKAPRLDRLHVERLGPPAELPHVQDPEVLLDPTAWGRGEWKEAEIRCRAGDLESVRSWFPRAEVTDAGDGCSALRFTVRNEDNLVDRVIGLAGTAWIVAPASALEALRHRVEAVLAQVTS